MSTLGSPGFNISPLSGANILNFSTDVAAIAAQEGGGTGLVFVATTDGITGSGIIGDPLKLKDNVAIVSITASLKGNGSQVTHLTASNIDNFVSDVRKQLNGTTYVSYDNSTGAISLPKTGSIIGSTEILLGSTASNLVGINNLSSTYITGTNISSSNLIGWASNTIRPYGSFYDTTTQTGTANVTQSFTYNSTQISNGVSIVSGSRIKVDYSGVYNIQFSAQIAKTGGNVVDTTTIWLSKNGTDVPWTATYLQIPKGVTQAVAAWNFVEQANSGEYFEIKWVSDVTGNIAYSQTGSVSPQYPGIPSLIVTIQQI